ncbi:MAG: pyruvate kinase, partial [Candidatus Ancillula sp.]|nr:pyruvate kinase [Candidatus Ancillula sp.]
MRKAKIVCTIGPATQSLDQMVRLVSAGMDVARLNRSHGDSKTHELVYNNVREAARKTGRNVAVLVDLQGPKIRLGKFAEDKKYELIKDDLVVITVDDILGQKQSNGEIVVGTTYKGLPGDVKIGDPLLIDDGKVRLEAIEVTDNYVKAKTVVAGPISNNKGINLPWAAVAVPALSEKDKDDLRWAVKIGADIIALSFVRSASDYEDALKIMEEEGRIIPVIAKIEKPQAVDNLEEIIKAFDVI